MSSVNPSNSAPQPNAPSHVPGPAPPPPRSFDDQELAALDEEDVQAGKIMVRLLCFFFLYTIVVTSIAAWWTWDSIRS
jgi:hypothetical protein